MATSGRPSLLPRSAEAERYDKTITLNKSTADGPSSIERTSPSHAQTSRTLIVDVIFDYLVKGLWYAISNDGAQPTASPTPTTIDDLPSSANFQAIRVNCGKRSSRGFKRKLLGGRHVLQWCGVFAVWFHQCICVSFGGCGIVPELSTQLSTVPATFAIRGFCAQWKISRWVGNAAVAVRALQLCANCMLIEYIVCSPWRLSSTTVTLYFAEFFFFLAPELRRFDVWIEDKLFFSSIDMVKESGNNRKAIAVTKLVIVEDELLMIDFRAINRDPYVSAIEVQGIVDGPAGSPTRAPTRDSDIGEQIVALK